MTANVVYRYSYDDNRSLGVYWSSSLHLFSYNATVFFFIGDYNIAVDERCYGLSIRPVTE